MAQLHPLKLSGQVQQVRSEVLPRNGRRPPSSHSLLTPRGPTASYPAVAFFHDAIVLMVKIKKPRPAVAVTAPAGFSFLLSSTIITCYLVALSSARAVSLGIPPRHVVIPLARYDAFLLPFPGMACRPLSIVQAFNAVSSPHLEYPRSS